MIRLSAFSDEAAKDLDGQIEALKRNGIPYTELRSVGGKNVRELSVKEACECEKRLSDNGIKVWAVGSPLGKVDIDIDFVAYLCVGKRAGNGQDPHIQFFPRLRGKE